MRKYRIVKEILKFFAGYLLYSFIGGIGLALGVDVFSHNLFHDGFNLRGYLLDLMRFTIAFGIVYGTPKLLKNRKS